MDNEGEGHGPPKVERVRWEMDGTSANRPWPDSQFASVVGLAIHRGLKNLGEKSHTGWSPVTRTKMYRNAKDERAICKIVVSRLKSGPVLQSKE